MQAISTEKAREILRPLGLGIGAWNEIIDIPHSPASLMRQPPRAANEMYVFCRALMQWLSCEDWVLIQVDDSTSPLEDEIEVMEDIFAISISDKADSNASFVMDGKDLHSRIALFIFFVIVFEWHVYLVPANSNNGMRLGLQDGVVHFFGSKGQLEGARAAVEKLEDNPLAMPKKGPRKNGFTT